MQKNTNVGNSAQTNHIFVLHGSFQVERSDDRTVVLKDLHVDMTGKFTCEVSTEGIFETVKGSAEMTVVGTFVLVY